MLANKNVFYFSFKNEKNLKAKSLSRDRISLYGSGCPLAEGPLP